MATTSTIATATWIDGLDRVHVNDIFLSSGQIAMATGKDAYANIINCVVRTRLGELPLDTEQGIPYFETVYQSPRRIPEFENALRSRIEALDFVEEVTSLKTDFDRERGVLHYSMTARTADGEDLAVSAGLGKNAYLDEIVIPQEGGNMQNLVQDGKFYLPVHIDNGVQKYRMLTDYEDPDDPDYGVQPAISEELYKKNPATGRFEEVSSS